MTTLKTSSREGKKRSELTKIRHEGDIPAVFYSAGEECHNLRVDGSEFRAALRGLKLGHLPTTVFEITIGGKKQKVIVRDIQYKPTTYEILHLDLHKLDDKRLVEVNVPIECEGVADSVGIKLGGVLRKVKRHVKVRCLPKDMPKQFTIDVRNLAMNQSSRVNQLDIPKGVEVLLKEQDVLVVIAKK
ncbi:MAG: 50S ribosomal protein L25/general stress protein Ctc [Candidatus Algichlamydia australiensis]|nr:50S ribosomal protein L25/general stress protein Ctc [Chlamydiales bacterium]